VPPQHLQVLEMQRLLVLAVDPVGEHLVAQQKQENSMLVIRREPECKDSTSKKKMVASACAKSMQQLMLAVMNERPALTWTLPGGGGGRGATSRRGCW
jgi:hypothetical protein